MQQTRGVVSHHIGLPGDVADFRVVAVVALVGTLQAAQVGGGVVSGDGPFVVAGDCRRVVGQGGGGQLADVVGLGDGVMVGHQGSLFQVAVGEAAGRVVGGDHAVLNVLGEREPPERRGVSFGEEDAAHAELGGVSGAQDSRLVRHDFAETCGARAEAEREGFEVVQVGADVLVDPNAMVVGALEAQLEGAKEAGAAGDAKGHKAKFTEEFLPPLDTDALVVPEGVEDCVDARKAVWWELELLLEDVEDPAEDELAGRPGAVAFEELADGEWWLAFGVCRVGILN